MIRRRSTSPALDRTREKRVAAISVAEITLPLSRPSQNGPKSILGGDRTRLMNEGRLNALVMPPLRREWLNFHLGGFHWVHNDLTDTNLKAIHSCPACRMFRDRHWPRGDRR